MATTTKKAVADDYLNLVRRFPLKHICSDRELKDAIAMIDELSIFDERKLSKGQQDYLLVLSDLVEKYEAEHHRIDLSHLSGLDALKFLMEQRQMSASDLGRLLGVRQLGPLILRGERQLSKEHIRILRDEFKVSADLFL